MKRNAVTLAITLFLAMSSASTAWADDWSYTVRPGDDLWTIARDYCGSAKIAPQIAAHNQIGDVYTLRVGSRVNIPTEWLVFAPTTARVLAVHGDVQMHSSAGSPGKEVEVQAEIQMGDIIVTGNGSVQVGFADQSTITVQPHSRVLFNKLTAFGPAGMVDTHLRFSYGQGASQVQPQNRGDRFRIETPEGIAAVRGTEFRVSYDADAAMANAETLEGNIVFTGFREIELPQGFGVAASDAGLTKETLLAAPNLGTTPEEVFSGDTIGWESLQGADGYLITWSSQTNSATTVARDKSQAPQTTANLPSGAYHLAVRGIAASGIQGYDAQQAVIVKEIPPTPATPTNLKAERQGRDLTVSWDEVSDVDRYIVTITGAEGAHVIETTDPNAFYVLPSRGKFVIEVASLRHSLHSPGVTTEISLQRPWWLLFLLIPVLAL